jgi:hypothetical protein
VHVAAADAARLDAHEHILVADLRNRHVGDLEAPRFGEEESLQKPSPFALRRTRIRYMSAVM